ncbi:putative coiled coil [Cryptosporidium bovis]|uniref:putative coiled coil n=1 Tax=Cryptosporidium bovis TaxID=310047 RepID=UPI00351AAEA6|nr:putative coiled coil [Cryptosporidium bovis]
MTLLNLPKRQWCPIRDSSVSFEMTYPQNVSLVQTVSTLQCNREYIVHMFSEIPRVILLESGTHCYEELNNNSNCSSKLAGLGMENFSLSQTSNNIVYTTGNDISMVNIQSDKVSTLVKGEFRWKNVLFNPEDDRFFVAWSENSVYIWNRSAYEFNLIQAENQKSMISKPSQSHSVGFSSFIRVYYASGVNIARCNFVGDYIVVFTKNGLYDIVSVNLSPGEYFRNFGTKSVLGKNSILLDVIVFPNIKSNEGSGIVDKVCISTLSVNNDIYKVELLSLPIDVEKDCTSTQLIGIHISEENKCISQHIANFISPFWDDYIAIHIFNQIVIFSMSNDFSINGVYLFPSRILETAAFRPPRNISWMDIGVDVDKKKMAVKQPIEVFVSNIFGGLESIIVPSYQADSGNATEDPGVSNDATSNHKTANISESKNDVTDDYYSALMSTSCLKVDKNHTPNGNKSQCSNNRSDILSSLFGTLNLSGREIENNKQNPQSYVNGVMESNPNDLKDKNELLAKDIKVILQDFIHGLKDSLLEIVNEKISPIEESIKEIKSLISEIHGIKDGNKNTLNSIKGLESLVNEHNNKITKKLDTADSKAEKMLKEFKSINEKLNKKNKNNDSKNGTSIEEFTRVIADSFETLTNVVSDLQSTMSRFESHISTSSSNNSSSDNNKVPDKSENNEIEAQIEDALNQKQYDRAFAIAISADQTSITSQSEKGYFHNEECWVLNLSQKFDPCIWLDNEPLPISYPVILGICKILSDTVPYLIISLKDLSGTAQQNGISDLKMRILWIKETIHCFEPFTDALTPNDIIQILNEISETINKCINLINTFSEGTQHSSQVPVCFVDGSILSDITSILRQIRRITRNITSNLK